MDQESNERQPELFDELPKAPRRRRLWPFKGLALTISYENLILGAILILMAMVVCFTIGVERGKRISPGLGVSLQEPEAPPTIRIAKELSPPESKPINKEAEPQAEEGGYSIQLITFSQENYVDRELAKLKEKGFSPYVVRSGKYFKILVGPYSSKEEALVVLKEFKSQAPYRSAYLKIK